MKALVVDDDRLVASSLKTILEAGGVKVAGTLNSGAQAVEQYETIHPDVLLMDIRMEGISGLEAAEKILKNHPDAKILFLTTFSDDEYIAKALRLGVKGYLLKQNFESIVPSVTAVCLGQRVFGDEIVSRLPSMMDGRKPDFKKYGLNGRETELLTQIAGGLSNREIADRLFLSEGTVRNYISALLEKLNLRDRTQLAIFYYKNR